MKLYELMAEQEAFKESMAQAIDRLVDPDTGEFIGTPEDVATLDALQGGLGDNEEAVKHKVEAIAVKIAEYEAEAKMHKEQKDKQAVMQKSLEKRAESLRKYLQDNLHGQSVKTPSYKVTFTYRDVVEVDDSFLQWAMSDPVGEAYLRYKSPEVDKTALKSALAAGTEIPYARIKSNESMGIK